MQTFICLLKGINVGGNNRIKMEDLKTLFTSLTLKNPRTYIQSGNIAFESNFESSYLQEIVFKGIQAKFALSIHPIIRSKQEWYAIIEKSPFTHKHDIGHLHLTLLESLPTSDLVNQLHQMDGLNDEWIIIGKEFYLVCNLKYSDTKFSNTFLEKTFKTKATTRNWKTVLAIQKLLG
jgi:uncharacterized protein (DUF1697 family)